MSFPFEKLDVYQRAVELADQTDSLIKKVEAKTSQTLVDQLSPAALSISLNIAEGNGRWHKPDKRNFFWIARGSTFECVPLFEILRRKNLLIDDEAQVFKESLIVIGKMLTNLVKAHE